MADWANLPKDLIARIANRVKVIEDFVAFGAVCTSWRIVATKDNFDVLSSQVPLLMLADKDEDHHQIIYSLSKRKVSPIFLPEVRGSDYVSIKEGWLCTVVNDTGEMNLLHPFSREKIHLPSLNALLNFHDRVGSEINHWGCIDIAVLSANPSLTSDYILMVHHYGPVNCLAFWRSGDLNWTHIDADNFTGGVSAIVYHKEEFYSMTHCGKVRAYEVARPNTSDQPIVKTRLVVEMDEYSFSPHVAEYYLVELSGTLLLVAKFIKSNSDNPYSTYHISKFKVHELDLIRGELKEEMRILGNVSMFLGNNWASCIDSSKFSGVKPNHIYFADKWLFYSGNTDMGAYNLEDRKIQSFYHGRRSICSPTWVMPSLTK